MNFRTSVRALLAVVVASALGSYVGCDKEQSASPDIRVTPQSLADLDLGIQVEIEPAHQRERVWFRIILPPSSHGVTIDKCIAQIGGAPGESITADVWCEVDKTDYSSRPGYGMAIEHSLIEGSFLVLQVGTNTYALDLWEFLLHNTAAILKGTLRHGNICGNREWRSADLIAERIIKGDPETKYRIPVIVKKFQSGMAGIWMLYQDELPGCDDDVHYRLIKFIPESQADDFERRIGKFPREK